VVDEGGKEHPRFEPAAPAEAQAHQAALDALAAKQEPAHVD
jgi:hypothetical protein